MASEYVDVLIIGAGLSGIGVACHLLQKCPGKRFLILESRTTMGGTWDLFRYPGIRSDSDMFTLGYRFRPWLQEQAIADGGSILLYIKETAREYGVESKIRYQHRVVRASFSSQESCWTVLVERTDTGEKLTLRAGFVYCCTGYYRYDEGYSPTFKGSESFKGKLIHPQHWPEDQDYTGKRIVVIGSGATAVTLIPALAERAAHVVMLQRSPSYILPAPSKIPLDRLLRLLLSGESASRAIRFKNIVLTRWIYRLSRSAPNLVRSLLRKAAKASLPEGFDVDTHFSPTYEPWDQRLCVAPDGDLYKVIKSGKASVVTDKIETLTEDGIRLASGTELKADIVVSATGLNLLMLGGISLSVDGTEVKPNQVVLYKGSMIAGIPNLALALGYTNASWTLKMELSCDYICRLLLYMDQHGFRVGIPRSPDPSLPTSPVLDLQAGYVLRAMDTMPRQTTQEPWRQHHDYFKDVRLLRHGPIDDGTIDFRRAQEAQAIEAPLA